MAALPASEGMAQKVPLNVAVLGASGDLAKRKTYPALFQLFKKGLLPEDTKIVGFARSALKAEEFRKQIREFITTKTESENATLKSFLENCVYVSGNYDDPAAYAKMDRAMNGKNRLFYLALPPDVFVPASKNIKAVCQSTDGFNRVIVEKPFGKDLPTAKKLGDDLKKLVKEEDLYRIDHYLGKDMVQNLLVTRFANSTFEKIWDKNTVQSVEITCKEKIGTEGRGGYFDSSGILRDITQNHLMQIFSLVAMEPPKSLQPEDIRNAKVQVLKNTTTASPKTTVFGQYTAGDGKLGYTDDITVPKNSKTPTFASTLLKVKNSRWEGVPFILKAGKALNNKKVDVRITFKKPTSGLYKNAPNSELVFSVQPDEAIYYKFTSKIPGLSGNIHQPELSLQYNKRYMNLALPDAYEALILDAITGKRNNFVRQDELEEAWRIFTPLLDPTKQPNPIPYPRGSRGPAQADLLKNPSPSVPSYSWPSYDLSQLEQIEMQP
eukprot:TRINITY_DN5288_c0_g1_i1.p1 TRINITY_DN5288_c0_g1~~TRINITY_DN5288_c0_g1_i1.p1  ORF type:complete len:511 (+),score=104.30 TRINITY_DN5288_c0_g1_i1:53-1534(+)